VIRVAPRPWPGTLDWGGDWLADAAAELEHLGFVLRDGSHTGAVPGPRLLIAFRAHPTLEHFDPEEVTFWEAHDGRGRLARLDASVGLPLSRPFAWGRITVTDRVPVSNQFLTFGGMVLGGVRDGTGTVLAFTSSAPIVRWAGHSQGVDPFTGEIGSFFARLMVPVDFQPDAEPRILETDPEALYAAFLQHAEGRLRPGSRLRDADPALASFVAHEARRLHTNAPAAWQEGEVLLGWLELG
jgi:hypothetical protein